MMEATRMPIGTPGMPGDKDEPYVIYQLKDGKLQYDNINLMIQTIKIIKHLLLFFLLRIQC